MAFFSSVYSSESDDATLAASASWSFKASFVTTSWPSYFASNSAQSRPSTTCAFMYVDIAYMQM